jgi:hypothetical protein
MNVPQTTVTVTSTANLGGPFQGYSPQQTLTSYKDSDQVMVRKIVRGAWNNPNAVGTINGKGRIATPFRAVNNLGDFLGRQNYVCGGSNQVNKTRPGLQGPIGSIISKCDGTGVPASVCNNRFVSDSSDYIRFKKQGAINRTFNDLASGGDVHNASFVARMAVHRGIRAI